MGSERRHSLGTSRARADPKSISTTRLSVRQHDIRGLQIAVHDAGRVDELQRLGDLPGVVHRVGLAHRVPQALAHAAAGEILQRQIQVLGVMPKSMTSAIER